MPSFRLVLSNVLCDGQCYATPFDTKHATIDDNVFKFRVTGGDISIDDTFYDLVFGKARVSSTGPSGEEDTNLVLSVMRAYKVKYYLVYHHGISQKRIVSAGLGETQPVADNSSLSGREQNRRVGMQFVF